MAGYPELDWYQEAWTGLGHAGLLKTNEYPDPALAEAMLRLRAVGLVVMYLGFYQAAHDSDLNGFFDDEHPPPLADYLSEAGIDAELLVGPARNEGYLDFIDNDGNALPDEEVSGQLEYDAAEEFARDAIAECCKATHGALEQRFGSDIELFVAIWNSRFAPEAQLPSDEVVNSVDWGDGKVEVWEYVRNGMSSWTWPLAQDYRG